MQGHSSCFILVNRSNKIFLLIFQKKNINKPITKGYMFVWDAQEQCLNGLLLSFYCDAKMTSKSLRYYDHHRREFLRTGSNNFDRDRAPTFLSKELSFTVTLRTSTVYQNVINLIIPFYIKYWISFGGLSILQNLWKKETSIIIRLVKLFKSWICTF